MRSDVKRGVCRRELLSEVLTGLTAGCELNIVVEASGAEARVDGVVKRKLSFKDKLLKKFVKLSMLLVNLKKC